MFGQSHLFTAFALLAGLFVLNALCQEVNPNDSLNDPFTTPNCVPGTLSGCVVPASLSGITVTGSANADAGDSVDGWGFVVSSGTSTVVTVTPIAPGAAGGGILQVITRTGTLLGLITFGGAPLVVTVGAGEYIISIQDLVGGFALPYTFGVDAAEVPPGITNDPHFAGLLGQSFLVNGVSGSVYNIISTPNMQVNALLEHINTLKLDSDSTWMTEVAIQVRTPGNLAAPMQRVYIAAQADGSISMLMNGAPIAVSSAEVAVLQQTTVEQTGSTLVRTSERDLVVMNAEFVLEINVDPIGHPEWCSSTCPHIDINAYAASDLQVLRDSNAHGLFGQTWRDSPINAGKEVADIEGEPQQYILRDGIWGNKFKFNRF